jgi:hypothetical protein
MQQEASMDALDWDGLVVRTPSRAILGVVAGVFADGPYAGWLRVHGSYHYGGRTRAAWRGMLEHAIPQEAMRRTRRRSLRLQVEPMAARAAWLVGLLPDPVFSDLKN